MQTNSEENFAPKDVAIVLAEIKKLYKKNATQNRKINKVSVDTLVLTIPMKAAMLMPILHELEKEEKIIINPALSSVKTTKLTDRGTVSLVDQHTNE